MSKYVVLPLGMLAVLMLAPIAEASCGSPSRVSSNGYIVTPNSPYAVSGGYAPSVTESVGAFFWAVGSGDPEVGIGIDSGSLPALSTTFTEPGILYSYHGVYPAYILSGWEVFGADGCPLQAAHRCTAVFLTDLDPLTGDPVFAILSDAGSSTNGYEYPGLTLAIAPKLSIVASRVIGTILTAEVEDPDLSGGLYLDESAACGGGLDAIVDSYVVCWFIQPAGQMPPSNFDRAVWTCGDEEALDGSGAVLTFDCLDSSNEVFLAWTLNTDSNFEMPIVSQNSTRVECRETLAEPEPRIRTAPATRERPSGRTRGR